MAKVLVTGGLGYIGSHTVVTLLQQNFEVVIVDDLSNSQASVLDRVEQISGQRPPFYQLNLCDESAVEQMFDKEPGIDSIIHFAASKAVGESVAKPLLYYKNNLLSLIHLLEQMNQRGITDFVFSSSCTVYGQPDKLPVTEQSPMKPAESPYGNTKQVGEQILQDACRAYPSLQVIALRYFNPVGAHESALIGELPTGVPNNLVPFITQTAAGLRPQLKVFGQDYDTPDGTAVRDYIHVVDLAEAHEIALRRLMNDKQKENFEFFNIGTGEGHSVLEVVKTFEKVNDLSLNYELADRRPGDVEQVYADTHYANTELGWKATRNLEEMLTSAWKWQKRISQ
ncbi:UDP-glucose 4-epimerase GalE [Tunicatimonas pelagia]|uniref:UDP-glucose 4-epimerase GalE n=1 Tax=Tunicatimonas pelagia TaxID=931531 RepID=UPI0026653AF0|nr:UDP-glucose 4-epimerase GalE [Tunicatimonas pelagia]WKN42794.1 UDP-glucose 4-epimerase GalE [Tunicatimonas pelagia]